MIRASDHLNFIPVPRTLIEEPVDQFSERRSAKIRLRQHFYQSNNRLEFYLNQI